MPKKIVVIAAAVAAALAVAVYLLTHTDEARIRRMCESAARTACRAPDEHPMEGAAKSKKLSQMIDDKCRIIIVGSYLDYAFSRDEIGALLFSVRKEVGTINVALNELDVDVFGSEARLSGVADFSGTNSYSPMLPPYVRPFRAELAKRDGEWLFTKVEFPVVK